MAGAVPHQHGGDVHLPGAQFGIGSVEIAAGQVPGHQHQVGGHHPPGQQVLGQLRLAAGDHGLRGACQVGREAGPQMLRRHPPALPLERVQPQHVPYGFGHLVRQHRVFLDAQRVEPAQLGAGAAGAGHGQPGQQLGHRHPGQLQADRVGEPAARAGPGGEEPFGGGAGTDLAQIHEGAAGRTEQPVGQGAGRGIGAGVVEQHIAEVGDAAADRYEDRQRAVRQHQRRRADEAPAPAHQDDPQPSRSAVRQPPRVQPGVALERGGGPAAAVQRPPLGGERGELPGVLAEGGREGEGLGVGRSRGAGDGRPGGLRCGVR